VIAAVPLGLARSALDAARELSSSKVARHSPTVQNRKPVVQGAFGRAEGMLRAARAFLFEACDEAWRTVESGGELTLDQRAAVRLSCAQVAEAAKSAVQIAYDIGGGTSVYESCPLQRCFRDMYAAVQHVQVQGGNFETVGRVLLGLDAGTPVCKGGSLGSRAAQRSSFSKRRGTVLLVLTERPQYITDVAPQDGHGDDQV
jgi:alkylation response protein AidB-like acyl-CoA dehydrogenase